MTAPIELVDPSHATVLAAIHRAAFPPDEHWSRDVMALQLGVPGAFGLLHLDGGMILVRVAADEAEVVTLAVTPVVRRQGLGEALLRAAMDHARRNGARMMFLEVDVENLAAQRLYGRMRFRQVGRRPNYYSRGTDALVLRADL
jgi:ribosomal-protein-alanine N-acetyltransferase